MKKFLYLLAKSAGNILLKYYNKDFTGLNIEFKSKNNPVTVADKESEDLLKNLILKKLNSKSFLVKKTKKLIDWLMKSLIVKPKLKN